MGHGGAKPVKGQRLRPTSTTYRKKRQAEILLTKKVGKQETWQQVGKGGAP